MLYSINIILINQFDKLWYKNHVEILTFNISFSDDPVLEEVKQGNNEYKNKWLHSQVDKIFQK